MMVETTSEQDKEEAEALSKDVRRIRCGMSKKLMHRSGDGGYPYESEAMAVDAEDIPRAREIARAHGLNTEYTPTGEPIITSAGHRLAHMRAFGFYDRNGVSSPRNR